MLGSEILDVALGMTFLYLLLSLVASAVREGVESVVKARAVHLERGIREMLDDRHGEGLARQLYEHPLISALFRGRFEGGETRRMGGELPTYIPARSFSAALLDLLARGPADDALAVYPAARQVTVADLRRAIDHVESPRVKRLLTLVLDGAGDDVAVVRANVEEWFNDTMDRVSGWYRRRTQFVLLAVAFTVSLALNVDSLAVANHLWRNKAAREVLAARAEAFARDTGSAALGVAGSPPGDATYDRQIAELRALDLPIGWSGGRPRGYGIVVKLLGLLITTFAITMGAPFWFDALKRVAVIRSTVKPAPAAGAGKGETPQGVTPAVPAADAPPGATGGGVVAAAAGGAGGAAIAVMPGAAGSDGGSAARLATGSPALRLASDDSAAAADAESAPPAGVAPDGLGEFTPHHWTSGNPEEGLL